METKTISLASFSYFYAASAFPKQMGFTSVINCAETGMLHGSIGRRVDVALTKRRRCLLRQSSAMQTFTKFSTQEVRRYLSRIKLSEESQLRALSGQADKKVLTQIFEAHVCNIPFENLNLVYEPARIACAGEIKTDLQTLYTKIVQHCRGGYCFETNELLYQILLALDFKLHRVGARVVQKSPEGGSEIFLGGLDHEIALVQHGGEVWVCDAGFGGYTCREPVLLTDTPLDLKASQGRGGGHRVRKGLLGSKTSATSTQKHREGFYMQRFSAGKQRWEDLYFFTDHEWRPSDFDIPNFWCSRCHPLFTKEIVVALQTPTGRKTLLGHRLRIYGEEDEKLEEINVGDDGLKKTLKVHFGLDV